VLTAAGCVSVLRLPLASVMIASQSTEERAIGTDKRQPNPIERRMSRFLREPPSVRTAESVIVTATAMVAVVGGVLTRFLDHDEYSCGEGGSAAAW
jgi:hypothetical protein